MKKTAFLIVLLMLFFQLFCFSESLNDTIIPLKTYNLRQAVSFRSVVKITVDDEYSFLLERKPYLREMSKYYKFLDNYEGNNDTLFIKVWIDSDKTDMDFIGSMSIKDGSDPHIVYYSDTSGTTQGFSAFNFYYSSCHYMIRKPLLTKRIIVLNEKRQTIETKIMKAKYSYSASEWGAGAGWLWAIKSDGYVIYRKIKWIS